MIDYLLFAFISILREAPLYFLLTMQTQTGSSASLTSSSIRLQPSSPSSPHFPFARNDRSEKENEAIIIPTSYSALRENTRNPLSSIDRLSGTSGRAATLYRCQDVFEIIATVSFEHSGCALSRSAFSVLSNDSRARPRASANRKGHSWPACKFAAPCKSACNSGQGRECESSAKEKEKEELRPT